MYKGKTLDWGPVIIWMVMIFMFSHQPADSSAQLSGGLLDYIVIFLRKIMPVSEELLELLHILIRKGAHFFIYFILGLLLYRGMSNEVPKTRWMGRANKALIIGVLYAITDEVHQLYIPGRSGQISDVLLDSFGVLCGVIVYKLICKKTDEIS